jgi:hypothetical protein
MPLCLNFNRGCLVPADYLVIEEAFLTVTVA